MGYYTQFRGEVVYNYSPELDCEIAKAIANLPYYRGWNILEDNPCPTIDEVIGPYDRKWYSWKEDMKSISQQFPGVTILIEGDGEEEWDMWTAFFRNGKCAYYNDVGISYPLEEDFE